MSDHEHLLPSQWEASRNTALPFPRPVLEAERPEGTVSVALMSCLVFPLKFVRESQSRDFSLSQRADTRATESKGDFSARASKGSTPWLGLLPVLLRQGLLFP